MRGKFIVIEGGDGAGKDTQIDLLKRDLDPAQFIFVKDPGGTDLGVKIRELVLFGDNVATTTETMLYLASRAQLVAEKIEPALAEGKHVISNRFSLSTIAYQIYGRERLQDLELLQQMTDFILRGVRPDLVIYLDCPMEEGLRRVRQSGEKIDRFEEEQIAFHERVREGYQKHLPEYEHVIIDALQPVDKVYEEVKKNLASVA